MSMVLKQLTEEFKLKANQINKTIELIDEGNTIPFIARYRKEMTGNLDDVVLREFNDRLLYLRNLENKKEEIKRLIDEQEKLTDELENEINGAETLQRLDDLYRPFRPKRRTRATIAKEKGLDPVADKLYGQETSDEELFAFAGSFIDDEKELSTEKDVLKGAMDIVAEIISDSPEHREIVRKRLFDTGIMESTEIKLKDGDEKEIKDRRTYEMYFDYSEPVKRIANHRVLALNRAEKEKVIRVKIDSMEDVMVKLLESRIIKRGNTSNYLKETIEDSYNRLVFPSIEREIRTTLTEIAEEEAIKVFGLNLKPLLMQAPIKDTAVIGYDPGFRTGCKVAAVDGTGKLLDYDTIYPTEPRNEVEKSQKILKELIKKYDVEIVAIGNGTASRESEQIVSELLKELDKTVYYNIVNEAGASVYSASKVGTAEYPDIDVSIRGAISIARRLQDPLAELVKIDPKHIGVGQYQHDLNQTKLSDMLSGVVESCVNSVGADLNTASVSLLEYVSGVSSAVAKNIFDYREEHGKFKNRKELLKVKRLGPATYVQCAGFLRISDGDNILDNTSVHPESYTATEKLLKNLEIEKDTGKLQKVNWESIEEDVEKLSEQMDIGIPTLNDIINELKKPGRDIREDMPKPIFRTDVLKMEDLQTGMLLPGTVRNVVDFGAFVDIGVKQDGLVHISQMSDKFVKNPMDVVSVGDNVEVKIINIDLDKNKIGLSMKGLK